MIERALIAWARKAASSTRRFEARRPAGCDVLDAPFHSASLEVRAGPELNDEGARVLQSVHRRSRIAKRSRVRSYVVVMLR